MSDTHILIEQFEGYVAFVASLREIDTIRWTTSITEERWSVRDIISHIMMWDKNFLDKIVSKLLNQEPVILEENLNIQEFNDRAVEYGKTLTQNHLLDEAIFYRSEIVSQLRKLPKSEFIRVFPGRDFTLSSYLTYFVSHSAHHKKQIHEFLSIKDD